MSKVETEVHRLMLLHDKIQTDLQRIANGLAIMNERMDRGFASMHRRFEEIAEERKDDSVTATHNDHRSRLRAGGASASLAEARSELPAEAGTR